MSVIFEKIVAEDLQRGKGSVTVTMPDGGTAPGQRIGTHTFHGDVWNVQDVGAVGDGTADDYVALLAAEGLVPSTGGTLFFPAGTYRVGTALTFGADVTLLFAHGAMLSIDSGITVTVNGVVQANRTQIVSGSGTVDLTDAKLDWVYPEWWGAVATKAATGTPADSTTAIEAAINTGRNVLFDQGIYGTTGNHIMNIDGQVVRGQGQQATSGGNGQGGTEIVRLSGTNYILKVGAYVGMEVSDFVFDGNSGDANSIQCVSMLYGTLRRIRFRGTGGTSYALYLSNINVSTFDQITFEDGNYGHLQTDSGGQCLYSTFTNLVMGSANGGYGIDFQNAAYHDFFGGHMEGPMRTGTNCRGLRFYNMTGEIANTTLPYFAIDSTSWNISWMGGYFGQSALTTQPIFQLNGCRGITIDAIEVRDNKSAAGRDLIQMIDAPSHITLSNWSVYCDNTFDFVVGSGTGNAAGVVCINNRSHSGGAGTNTWQTSGLYVIGGNLTHTWTATAVGESTMIDPVGTVTKTNAGELTIVGAQDAMLDLTDADATPDISTGATFRAANTGATTVTALDGGYDGKEVYIRMDNGNTTFDFTGTTLFGNAGVDWTAPANSALKAKRIGNNWYCTIVPGA